MYYLVEKMNKIHDTKYVCVHLTYYNEFKKKYFENVADNAFQVSPELKKSIEFKEHNLLRDPYPTGLDLIVCRNVLIYFTEEAKDEIYKKFCDSLKPGAILFLGSTEQIIQPQRFGFETISSFFYKKKQ